ncbi:hypothetical protein AB8O55_22345 [Saccharopolyspora cebuensis]|uniref:Uncharacterized protein n=1 Tax=Saccharopolyspora cebuensis TaxID=418759 RepID=A0ABV4CM63_9PSEU
MSSTTSLPRCNAWFRNGVMSPMRPKHTPQIQPQQRLLAVHDDQPITSHADDLPSTIHVNDDLDEMREHLRGGQGGAGEGLAEEAHTVVEGSDVALAGVELQAKILQLGTR